MLFSERLEMEKAYKEYLKQNPMVADSPFTVITFMDKYFKDENKEVDEIKKEYEEASKLQRELLQQYDLYFKSFGCESFEEFKELIGLAYISNDDKEMIDNAKHQGYIECEKQLAEKDKEIEKYANDLSIALSEQSDMAWKWTQSEKQLRHQVCEEIRHKAKWRNPPSTLQFIISAKDLKQIEQGERNYGI